MQDSKFSCPRLCLILDKLLCFSWERFSFNNISVPNIVNSKNTLISLPYFGVQIAYRIFCEVCVNNCFHQRLLVVTNESDTFSFIPSTSVVWCWYIYTSFVPVHQHFNLIDCRTNISTISCPQIIYWD